MFPLQIVSDRETGKSKGYAFVLYNDFDAMNKALDEVNGIQMG